MQIQNQLKFDAARRYAQEIGGKSFYECLHQLLNLEANYKGELVISGDFSPYSLSFGIYRGAECMLNGGVIFHPGATGPDNSLSVELVSSDEPHWSIHT
jgi:hypothetical protein